MAGRAAFPYADRRPGWTRRDDVGVEKARRSIHGDPALDERVRVVQLVRPSRYARADTDRDAGSNRDANADLDCGPAG